LNPYVLKSLNVPSLLCGLVAASRGVKDSGECAAFDKWMLYLKA